MVNYKSSKNRAKETATFRFTSQEKELIDLLSKTQGITRTDLIRKLLYKYAKELQLIDKNWENDYEVQIDEILDFQSFEVSDYDDNSKSIKAEKKDNSESKMCFGDMAEQFKIYFQIRSEKMQKELKDTIEFVTSRFDPESEPIFPRELKLEKISTEYLHNARERLKNAPIKFPQKNLHLNYLRMLFSYGLKENLVSNINPSIHLRTYSAKEVADAFPAPSSPI